MSKKTGLEEWQVIKLLRPLAPSTKGRLHMEGVRRVVTPTETHYDVCDGSMALRVTLPHRGEPSSRFMGWQDARRYVGSEGTAVPVWVDGTGFPPVETIMGQPTGEPADAKFAPWRMAMVLGLVEKIAKAAGVKTPSAKCEFRAVPIPSRVTVETVDVRIVAVVMPMRS